MDGTAVGGQSLILNTGSGHVTLGNAGATTRLASLTDNNATTLTGSSYDANSLTFGALTLADDVSLDTSAANGAILVASVDGTVAGAQSLTVNSGSGKVTVGSTGATTRLGSLTDNSTTTLDGSTYDANSIAFGALTLADDVTLDTSAANGAILVASVDGTTAGGQSLTLKSGTGNVDARQPRRRATTRLASLTDNNTTTLTGSSYDAISIGFGALTLADDVTLDTSAANGAISVASVDGTTVGGQSLTLKAGSGNVTLGNAGATSASRPRSPTATLRPLTGSDYDANSIAFGALTLADDVTLDTSAANGAISVASVDGTTVGAQALVIKAGNGHVTLGNTGATTRLGALTDHSATTLTGSAYDANSISFGALTLADDVTLDTSVANGAISVTSVDGTTAGAQSLTLKAGSGNVTLGNTGATTRLASLTDNTTPTLNGSSYAADSNSFGALTLADDVTLDTSAANGAISVTSVDGTTAGAQSLTLKSGTGNVTLGNAGATTRLASLTDNNATTLTGSDYDANSIGFGALTLGPTTSPSIPARPTAATLVASVDGTSAGGQSLTLKSGTGNVTLGNAGATTRLGALNDSSATTLTGSDYDANSISFGALTLKPTTSRWTPAPPTVRSRWRRSMARRWAASRSR